MIVQELYAIQQQQGFLSEKALRGLAARTGTHLHRLHEVASFFPHFRLEQAAPIEVRICQDMSCHLRGSCDLSRDFQGAAGSIEGARIDVQVCHASADATVHRRFASRQRQPYPNLTATIMAFNRSHRWATRTTSTNGIS